MFQDLFMVKFLNRHILCLTISQVAQQDWRCKCNDVHILRSDPIHLLRYEIRHPPETLTAQVPFQPLQGQRTAPPLHMEHWPKAHPSSPAVSGTLHCARTIRVRSREQQWHTSFVTLTVLLLNLSIFSWSPASTAVSKAFVASARFTPRLAS